MRSLLALLCGVVLLTAASSRAQELPAPKDSVVLEVRGNLALTNAPGAARFDLAMLKALGVETIATTTPWTEGVARFDAIPGAKLLEAIGARGTVLVARAVNDYKVEIPIEDLRDKGAFLAFAMNGKALSRRDKGPLWVLYPFDGRAELKGDVYYNRSIWQLTGIEVK